MIKQSIVAGALALAATCIHAASTGLEVEATITPEACSLTLAGGGKVDYGSLGAATVKGYALWNGTYRTLPMRSVQLEIHCSASTAFALSVADNKAASKPSGLDDPDGKFGLGMFGTQPIGFLEIKAVNATASFDGDGWLHLVESIGVRFRGGNWQFDKGPHFDLRNGSQVAFGAQFFSRSPDAVDELLATLEVTPRVADAVVDGATAPIQFDGAITVLIDYV